MKNFLKKAKRWILSSERNNGLTNRTLEDLIVDNFKDGIGNLSLRNRVLYPTDFTILLHSDDFKKMNASFAFIAEDCIKEFVKILKEKMKGNPSPPPAHNWHFQFAQCTNEAQISNTEEKIAKNKAVIVFGLATQTECGNRGGGGHFVRTQYGPVSRLSDHVAINEEGLGVNYLGANAFEYPIRLDPIQQQSKPDAANQDTNTTARLNISGKSFVEGNNMAVLLSPVVLVCGKVGLKPETDQQVVCIDDVNVANPHFKIERSDNKYKITTYASIRLNGVDMGKNKSRDLPANSNIVINNMINLRFNPNGR